MTAAALIPGRVCFAILRNEKIGDWLNTRTVIVLFALVTALLSLSASANTQTKPNVLGEGSHIAAANAADALPTSLRPLSRNAALELNRTIPFTTEPNVPAQPFAFTGDDEARTRALACLTAAIYYEAGNEPEAGKRAVAQVVLNRVRNPAFPSNVCGVVFQGSTLPSGCQFTFTCDSSLLRIPERSSWAVSERIASDALSGAVFAPVGLSTHYHADYVVPYWATKLAKTAQVGAHIFYRWPSAWADLRPFQRRYDGHEADPAALRAAALMTDGFWPQDATAIGEAGISIKADTRLQLIGVVRLLASAEQDSSSAYENDVRAYFAAANDSPAVQLFRGAKPDNSAAPPPDQNLIAALAAFDRQTDWKQFLRDHRSFYDRSISGAERKLKTAVEAWQAYTALPLRSGPIAIAVGPSDDSSTCLVATAVPHRALWVWGDDSAKTPADLFLATGLSAGIFSSSSVRAKTHETSGTISVDPALEQQVVRAVFARIEALAAGDADGNSAAAREAQGQYALVPELARRLTYYEHHRGDYPNLATFLPTLLDGLPSGAANGAVDGSTLGGCHRRATNQVASATADLPPEGTGERLRETP